MRRISFEEFSAQSKAFDAAVMQSGNIDAFCSSSDWILPACQGLMADREPWIFEEEGCFWAFMRAQHAGGFRYLEPLEAMWALACPVVGPDVERLAAGIERLCELPISDWRLMLLAGMPAGHPLLSAVVSRLGGRMRLSLGESSSRLIADLTDGMAAYLDRRSHGFRRSIRRAQKRTREAGITFEDASAKPAESNFARIVDVERRGWKGRDDVGIQSGGMHDFYELMLPRLAARSAQQVRFARHKDRDVAYIMGGLHSDTYRGLQFSYDVEYAEFGLGNVLQVEQMTCCHAMGANHYDLGMWMDYKLRWSDRSHDTVALFIIRD